MFQRGQQRAVYAAGGSFALSQDGWRLAVSSHRAASGESVLHVAGVEGEPARELIRVPDTAGAFVLALDWTLDGRILLFTRTLAGSGRRAE